MPTQLLNRKQAFKAYCKEIAKGYDTDSTVEFFDVTPPKESKLHQAIVRGSEFLQKINVIEVDQVTGQAVFIGSDQLSTGRVENGRFDGQTPEIDGYEYTLYPTDTIIQMTWVRQAAWINSGSQGQFNQLVNGYTNKQIAADIVKVGWNGEKAEKVSDPVENPLGQDVNEGWHARVKRLKPDCVVMDDGAGGQIYVDFDGLRDDTGALRSHYKTLDAMASDLINNYIAAHNVDASDLVVLVGRELIAAAQYKLYSEADKPSEQIDAQRLEKSIAGRPAYVPSHFPGKRMVVTSFANLSVYTQRGTKRRKVKDNDDKARAESTYWRMEGYMVEDLDKYAAFDESAIELGPWDVEEVAGNPDPEPNPEPEE